MNINIETRLYGSFSLKSGNNGNIFFNTYFEKYNVNAIYKAFSIDNIELAVKSARLLNFGGFAISMPFKKEVLQYIDEISDEVKIINACNTVVNNGNGKLIEYNTDYLAIKTVLSEYIINELIILGNGGLARTAYYASDELDINYRVIKRSNWNDISSLKNKVILNCTPVTNIKFDLSNIFIDTLPTTDMGKKIHRIQAKEQFYLYTGIKIEENVND